MQIPNFKGQVFSKLDATFDQAIQATLFNQRNPGRKPEIMIFPKDVQDVISAIRYAKSAGLRVSVCSGGHSWSANHLRPDSLLINMSAFNSYEIDRAQMLAKAGPAVGGSILLTKLTKLGLFFPAGHCKGVCLGGYLLQGGFAWNGRKLGMACESVLGLDIVTANGELVHASATENADLYWAARGSGGGFFGVVVQFYLRLYPRPKYGGMVTHAFSMKHLEAVCHWAYEVGPSIPAAVEFQMLMSNQALGFFGPGMEAIAPIFADSKEELYEASAFMRNSPVKNKAFFRTGFVSMPISWMYSLAMTHYPHQHYWGVDNMWTSAKADDLIPQIKAIAATLPPPPAHILWLNWQPPVKRSDMAFSMEDKIYIALYGAWKSPNDTPRYENWATDWMQKLAPLATGIQLADENLHKRPARFLTDQNLEKLDFIRSERDASQLFNAWHSRPDKS